MKTRKPKAESETVESNEFQLDEFLPYRLSVTANQISRMFARRYADDFGLTIAEWRVLAVLGQFGTLSPTTIGELAAMDKVKVSRATAGLVAKGLVRQRPDPEDGRGRRLQLSAKGAKIRSEIVPLARDLETTLASSMSRVEWQALRKALTKLNEHARGMDWAEAAD